MQSSVSSVSSVFKLRFLQLLQFPQSVRSSTTVFARDEDRERIDRRGNRGIGGQRCEPRRCRVGAKLVVFLLNRVRLTETSRGATTKLPETTEHAEDAEN